MGGVVQDEQSRTHRGIHCLMQKGKGKNGGGNGRARNGQGGARAPRKGDGDSQSAAVAYSKLQGSSRPEFLSVPRSGDLRIRVRHREFVNDISGNTSFGTVGYYINPGLRSSFPWLSNVANNFETYRFNKLCYEYRTASATSEIGKALLAVDCLQVSHDAGADKGGRRCVAEFRPDL